MKSNFLFKILFLVFLPGVLVSCSVDDDSGEQTPVTETFNTQVLITDAPIDNPEIEGAFITISEVRVNGEALNGFQKSTVEISSLTNGETQLLGNIELLVGSTTEIVLVLSDTDASGNAPGNYVLTIDGEKDSLLDGTAEISVNDNAEIRPVQNNELVLDFDLRKAIVTSGEGDYSFVGSSSLGNNIRAVNKEEAGTIAGNVNNMQDYNSERMVVFAYEKGTYNEDERNQNQNGVRFANAASSSLVNESGDFSLHFLEEGEYELYFISFADKNNDNQLEFEGRLEMSAAGDLNLLGITVNSNSTVSVEVLLTGLLGL